MRVVGVLWFLVMAAYFVMIVAAAWAGIGHFLPWWLAGIALFLCFVFRFELPVVAAAFIGAWLEFGWPWPLALLFAAPGIALLIPAVAGALLGEVGERFRQRRRTT